MEMAADSGGISLSCCVCDMECVAYRQLKKHYKKKHPEYDLILCLFCKFVTVGHSDMKKHKKREHPKDRFTCSHCMFSTKSWNKWTQHEANEHAGENLPDTTASAHPGESLPDTTADAHATSSLELDSQNMSHADVASKTKTVSKLATAMNLPANRSNSTFQEFGVQGLKCPQCTTSRQHTDEGSGACSHCGFCGQDSHSVPSPRDESTAKSRFLCEICQKPFAKKINLSCHMRTHMNYRPYQCQFCDYLACTNDTLQQHLRGHLGIKPYKCEVCDYSSPYRSNIVLHAVTHSIDRPFSCDFCKKQFKRKDHMSIHLKRKHVEMM